MYTILHSSHKYTTGAYTFNLYNIYMTMHATNKYHIPRLPIIMVTPLGGIACNCTRLIINFE